MNFRRIAAALPLLICVLVTGLALWHASVLLERPAFPFDDAYISFRYADNFVRGRGLVYNPGEPVEGYTNFLWVLLIAAGIRLGFDPLDTAQVLGGASLLICLVLLARLVWVAQRGVKSLAGKCFGVWAATASLFWLLHTDGFVSFATCGLETLLAATLALAVGLVSHLEVDRWKGWKLGWVHSLAPAALILTRMDGAVFVAVSGLIFLWRSAREKRASRCSAIHLAVLREGVQRYALLAVIVGSWLAWKYSYYGHILPNTYYAKGADEPMWNMGAAYLWKFVESYPATRWLAVLAVVGIVLEVRERSHDFVLWGSTSLALFSCYIVRVGGDFMHYRFAFEAYAVLLGCAAVALVLLARYHWLPPVVLALVLGPNSPGKAKMETKYAMQDLPEMKKFVYDGTRSGPRLKNVLPPDTIISTSLAGTIAYFSDLTTIDELGLNDAFVARQEGHALVRGHGKRAPLDYLRRRRVNLVLIHPWDVPCTPEARNETRSQRKPHSPLVWLHIDKGDCVRMEYLTTTPKLTRWLCEHPEHFIVEDIECPGR